ncbi:MAG: hypothetical protein AVDCRST_MAG90-1024, partial [uncultured Microvirga sp.]
DRRSSPTADSTVDPSPRSRDPRALCERADGASRGCHGWPRRARLSDQADRPGPRQVRGQRRHLPVRAWGQSRGGRHPALPPAQRRHRCRDRRVQRSRGDRPAGHRHGPEPGRGRDRHRRPRPGRPRHPGERRTRLLSRRDAEFGQCVGSRHRRRAGGDRRGCGEFGRRRDRRRGRRCDRASGPYRGCADTPRRRARPRGRSRRKARRRPRRAAPYNGASRLAPGPLSRL